MGLRQQDANKLSQGLQGDPSRVQRDIFFTDEGAFDASGRPLTQLPGGGFGGPGDLPRPGFIRPEGQPVTPQLQSQLGNLPQLQGGAFNALRAQALQTTPSNFARLQAQRAQENIAAQSAGQAATARGNLAARGGLSTGARERVEADVARQALLGGQQARLTIGQQEAQRRQGLLQALPGLEVRRFQAAVQPQLQQAGLLQQGAQFDASQTAEANRLENLFNLAEADRQAQIFAAQLQADAIRQS